jgi:hypothetical protein
LTDGDASRDGGRSRYADDGADWRWDRDRVWNDNERRDGREGEGVGGDEVGTRSGVTVLMRTGVGTGLAHHCIGAGPQHWLDP